MASYKITLTTSGWTSEAGIYYDTVSGLFYSDADLTTEIARITPARRECFRFLGWYNSSSGTTQYIDETGEFTDAFRVKCDSTTSAFTVYARGDRESYRLTLNANGGSSENAVVYFCLSSGAGTFYADDLCEGEPVESFAKPVYDGKIFRGYYNGNQTLGANYVDKDGNFTDDMYSLVLSADKTIYAAWQNPVKITVSAQNGSGGTTAFYRDPINGLWSLTTDFSNPTTSIVPNVRPCHDLLGCYNSTSGSTLYVEPDGTIAQNWKPTAAATVYCRWTLLSYSILISKQSGTGGSDYIYTRAGSDENRIYSDERCEMEISVIDVPKREMYSFAGIFSASSGGTAYFDRNGNPTAAFSALSISANKTFYAQWKSVYKLTLNDGQGSGGPGAIYYDPVSESLFADKYMLETAVSATCPKREGFRFEGYFSSSSGGTIYVAQDGTFTPELLTLAPTGSKTFYARWTRVSYKVALDAQEGSGGDGCVYIAAEGARDAWHSDDQLHNVISRITAPERRGHEFLGFYTAKSGGSKYINADGTFTAAPSQLSTDTTLYARWKARSYTLTFDYAGGTQSTVSMTVTYGERIGNLPDSTRNDASLAGWIVQGTIVNALSTWDFDGDAVAVANWRLHFWNLTDWFNASNDTITIVSSDSGEARKTVNLYNGSTDNGARLPNPVCTYRITAKGRISIRLGIAYGSYFLTEAEYTTGADQEPMLVLRGVANEGANAINLYPITIDVDPDHIAQDPVGAVSGGGELTACTTRWSCDPVVVYENCSPVASDVVHGKITVSATTNAFFGESAPETAGGFVDSGNAISESDVDYSAYHLTAERSL